MKAPRGEGWSIMRATGAALEPGGRAKGRRGGEGWGSEGCTWAHHHGSGLTPSGSSNGQEPLSNAMQ